MSEINALTTVEANLQTSIATAKQYFGPMVQNAKACVTLLSQYSKKFEAQSEYDAAMDALGKVKTVMEKIESRRKEISGNLDELKQVLMTPEKDVKAAYEVAKSFCNAWNQKMADDAKAEAARIKLQENQSIELVNIETAIRSEFEMFILRKKAEIDSTMVDYFSKITLDNFAASEKALSGLVKLKQADYDALFTKYPAPLYATPAQVDKVMADIKAENGFAFAGYGEIYSDELTAKLRTWAAKLPAKKAELEDLVKQSAAAQAVAAKAAAERAAQEKLALAAEAEAAAAAKTAELDKAADDKKMTAQFVSQLQTQNIEKPTGVMTMQNAKFICEEKDMPVALAELIFKCITHPKHAGIYQKDKQGNVKKDEDGNPLYADWIESMLKFYATNCKPTITGIETFEKVSTINRKQ